jgi:hypothetical protein
MIFISFFSFAKHVRKESPAWIWAMEVMLDNEMKLVTALKRFCLIFGRDVGLANAHNTSYGMISIGM